MAIYTLQRLRVRADAAQIAERALHAYASFVRAALPGLMWTAYREPGDPGLFVALARAADAAAAAAAQVAPGTAALHAALAPLLAAPIETSTWELVTSSDLAPRPRPARARPRRR